MILQYYVWIVFADTGDYCMVESDLTQVDPTRLASTRTLNNGNYLTFFYIKILAAL